MVTLVIPPKEVIGQAMGFLNKEYAEAANIKSKQTMTSVQSAITSTREKLKLYRNTPTNGLIVFCGQILMEDNKTEKKITLDIEPFRPCQAFMYKCENKFHASCLNYLLEDDEKFGFIVVDGGGALFATLQGNVRNILHKIQVDLPKKHGRGGQSANRFARLREEKRHAYVRRVAELATQNFITNDRPNVKGIVMAGSADFKTVIQESDLFDPRLKAVLVATFDVSYGGENGLSQAITQSADALANVRFVEERRMISKFFEEISLDTGMIVFGVHDTMKALEMSALEKLLLYEDVEMTRYVVKNPVKGDTKVYYLTPAQEKDPKYWKDADSGIDLEVIENDSLADWLCVNYQHYGCKIELISDKTQEGFQFVKGFGGIGGMLRYKVDLDEIADNNDNAGGDDFDPDEDFI
jgi:peptide chain release factor subunit 1